MSQFLSHARRTALVSALFGTGLLGLATPAQAEHVIDALVVYSPGVTQKYSGDPQTRIAHLVGVTNKIYADSGVDAKLRIVHAVERPLNDGGSTADALSTVTNDATIKQLRDQYGADVVVAYRPYSNDGYCGLAWLGGYANSGNFAYAHVAIDCGDYVTAHELGHVMGLGHSHSQGQSGIYGYALGHGVQNSFATVMAYQQSYGIASKIYKFSSPNLSCNGVPCGVPVGQAGEADAVKALGLTVPNVASYRASKVVDASTPSADPQIEAARQAFEQAKASFTSTRTTYLQRLTELKQQHRGLITQVKAYNRVKAAYDKTASEVTQGRSSATTLTASYQQVVAALDTYEALRARRDVTVDALSDYVREVYQPALTELETHYQNYLKLSQLATR
ncbi:MAG: M12 family metallo-peptidase [Thiotrichales bacterium]